MHVEYSDPMDPVLFNRTNERLNTASIIPTHIYSTCTLNDQHRYEIRGNCGSVSYLSVNLSNSDTTGKMLLTGFVEMLIWSLTPPATSTCSSAESGSLIIGCRSCRARTP